jgi:predicted GNAT family acetyltransferase
MGQNPPGQPVKPGQPVPPGQQSLDPQQQAAQEIAAQAGVVASDLDKAKTTLGQFAGPGAPSINSKQLASQLVTLDTKKQIPTAIADPLIKATGNGLTAILSNPEATTQFQTALNTAKQPVK